MAITPSRPISNQNIAAGTNIDVLTVPDGEKYSVRSLNIHAINGSAGGNIELFVNNDGSNTAASRVFQSAVGADETINADNVPIVLSAGQRLVARSSAAGLSVAGSYTRFTGSQV